jgi:hypothetical protein
MVDSKTHPAEYPDWRESTPEREVDASYTFGYHVIRHCRDEALAGLPQDAPPEVRAAAEAAVDTALHNLMDLLEGFWPLESGSSHTVEYALQVRVRDARDTVVETVEVSPAKLDLPIGYWKWARDRAFRA